MNFIKIHTTREESVRLMRCGLDPDSADMVFYNDADEVAQVRVYPMFEENEVPAWSVAALLNMLPGKLREAKDISHYLEVSKTSIGLWQFGYNHFFDREQQIRYQVSCDDVVAMLVELICNAIEDGYEITGALILKPGKEGGAR
jgi:hypothetical protein